MRCDEVIILPLPQKITHMLEAAAAYRAQYGAAALLQVWGTVLLEGGHMALLPNWRSIARFDHELGLVSFGNPDEREEDLLWAYPLGPGDLRVATQTDASRMKGDQG